jgi:hypothetical protein
LPAYTAWIWADHNLKPWRRRGRLSNVAELTHAITTWAEHWNADPKPFIWKATADEIIAKVQRGRDTLHQIKSTTGH